MFHQDIEIHNQIREKVGLLKTTAKMIDISVKEIDYRPGSKLDIEFSMCFNKVNEYKSCILRMTFDYDSNGEIKNINFVDMAGALRYDFARDLPTRFDIAYQFLITIGDVEI